MNNTTLNVLKNLAKSYAPLNKKRATLVAKRDQMLAKFNKEIEAVEADMDILNTTSLSLTGKYTIPQIINEEYLNDEDAIMAPIEEDTEIPDYDIEQTFLGSN